MAEKLILTDGLVIKKEELAILQTAAQTNLSRLVGLIASIPAGGAVFTTKSTAGVLGSQLSVVPGGGTSVVQAGTAIAGDFSYINVPSNTTPTGTFSNSTSVKVILSAVSSSLEAGTVSVASDHITLTFTVNVSAIYSAGGYIRLSGSVNGNNGTYRILSVSGTTAVLSDATSGTAESGLLHSQAGKFFPGYPLSGTTDEVAHDSFALTYQSTAYTPLANEIHLATLAKDGGGTVTLTTDFRVPITPNMLGRIITDADISTTAAIAESKIALAASTIAAKANNHVQNTDTYTTSSTFRVNGTSGPRVLTTDDISVIKVTPPPVATAPSALAQEVNYVVSFYNAVSSPDATLANQNKVPMLRATWGINGQATYSGSSSSGTLSFTGAHDLAAGTSLGVNSLVDHIAVDSTGQKYRITANSAINPSASFTATVVVDSVGSQPTPTNGAVLIRTSAASYQLNIVDTTTGNIQSFQVPVTPNGSLPLAYNPPLIGVKGRSYRVDLVSINNSLTPTTQTLSVTVPWGQTSTATINVPSTSIVIAPSGTGVSFSWPAPANYNKTNMDYAVAWTTTSGTNPTYYNTYADEQADGSGRISLAAAWPQVVTINVKVVDMSGLWLGNSIGTATGQPTQVSNNPPQTLYIPYTSVAYGSFAHDAGSGLDLFPLDTKTFPRSIALVGVGFICTAYTGDMVIKGMVYPTGTITSAIFTQTLSTAGGGEILTPVDPTSAQMGTRIDIKLDRVSGTTGSVTGVIAVHYIVTGSINAPTQPTF